MNTWKKERKMKNKLSLNNTISIFINSWFIKQLNNSTQKCSDSDSNNCYTGEVSQRDQISHHYDSHLCFSKIHQKPHTDWTRNEPICLWTQSDVRMLRCIIVIMYNDCSLCSCNACSRWFREPQTPEFSWTCPAYLLYWSLINLAANISKCSPEKEGKWVLFIIFRQRTPQGRSFLAGCKVEYLHHNSAEEGALLIGIIPKWPDIHFDSDREIMASIPTGHQSKDMKNIWHYPRLAQPIRHATQQKTKWLQMTLQTSQWTFTLKHN